MAKDETTPDAGEVALPAKMQLEAVYRSLQTNEPLPITGDPEVMSRLIMERILAAETFDEAFRPQKLDAWREAFPERAVRVLGLHFNNSAIEGGSGAAFYAVVDLVDVESGVTQTVTCGGRNVLAQLVKMVEKGWQDHPVRLTSKRTSEGYNALWLEAA